MHRQLRQDSGIAMLMAITTMILLFYLVVEVTYDSSVEYIVNSQSLSRIKAYYAAKAGADLSLLRIKTFQVAKAQLGQQLGENSGMLDQIWKFPMAWPLPAPPELNAVDKDTFKKLTSESLMEASYFVTIDDEGSKIDINDLNSSSKTLKESAKTRLLNLFEIRKKNDKDFELKYSNYKFEELINSITDWMTDKALSLNGGNKSALFKELNIDGGTYFPPNRAYRSLGELHLVPGMNDEFFEILEPQITLYGMKGINPNFVSKEVLMGLDVGITEKIADEIILHRDDPINGGPFKTAEEFWNFATSKGARIESKPESIPLVFTSVMNFRIKSNGEFGGASRQITLLTYDLIKSSATIRDFVDKDKPKDDVSNPDGNPPGTSPTGKDPKKPDSAKTAQTLAPPKGPPRIVQWIER